MSKILGLDYGARYIGLALADAQTKIATPWKVITNQGINLVLVKLKKICQEEQVGKIIIGLPVSMRQRSDNSQGPRPIDQHNKQFQEVQRFVKLLKNNLDIKIITEDERLSSRQANSLMKGQGKKGERDDAVAAMVILQSYIDKTSEK